MKRTTTYKEIQTSVEELARKSAHTIDMGIAWMFLVDEYIPKAQILNKKINLSIWDKRTRGGKYIALKEKEFYEKQ